MNERRCQICAHARHDRVGLHCPSCVRALLYPLRIQQAGILLEREGLAAHVEQILSLDGLNGSYPLKNTTITSLPDRQIGGAPHRSKKAELEESRRKIDVIAERAATWRAAMQAYRRRIGEQTAVLQQRRGDINSVRTRLNEARQSNTSVGLAFHGPTASLVQGQHERIVHWRVHHLRDLAFWSRLQRVRRPWSGQGQDSRSFEYHICGLPVPDLRKLNHFKDGDQHRLTAVLTHICRLLHLVSRYLQVRLPAEVIVPHRGWPLPMVLSPATSYTGEPLAFPYQQLTSPSSSRGSRNESYDEQRRSARRPRPLFLVRQLDQMACDDAPGHSRFIEAVALLAWNVAWLCRTQGLPVADTNWEDACDMGRNLWQLLVDGPQGVAAASRTSDQSQKHGTRNQAQKDIGQADMPPTGQINSIGRYSHGSAFNYLRAGSNMMAQLGTKDVSARGWIMASPVKLVSELRANLLGELSVMEAVLVGEDGEELGTAENGMQLNEDGAYAAPSGPLQLRQGGISKGKGTSGWTKLRTRRDSKENS